MNKFCFFLIFQFINIAFSSHFRGGTIMWKPIFNNDSIAIINVTIKLGWRRDMAEKDGFFFFCDQSTIENRYKKIGEKGLTIQHGISEQFKGVYCTDFSETENWSYGEITFPVTYNDPYKEKTLSIKFEGKYWIDLIKVRQSAKWNLISRVNLNIQKHSKNINQSPVTTMTPLRKIAAGCYHEINIPVSDKDNDVIRCRWSKNEECGSHCSIPPNTILDEKNCKLHLNLTGDTGNYAIRLQIEDFAAENSTEAISSIPLEFLLITINQNCSFIKPTLVNEDLTDDKKCIITPLKSRYLKTIMADTNNTDDKIIEITTVLAPGFAKSDLHSFNNSPSIKYVNISWTPNENKEEKVCFMGTSTYSTTSQRCISIAAGYQLPKPLNKYPEGILNTKNSELSITADQVISRPKSDRFIRFYDNDTHELVYKVNVANESQVEIINQTIKFQIYNILKNNKQYYINLDEGVLQRNLGCELQSEAINSQFFWTISVKDVLNVESSLLGLLLCEDDDDCYNYLLVLTLIFLLILILFVFIVARRFSHKKSSK
jgi:hypothetical protein